MLFRIQANFTVSEGKWLNIKQVPTFCLDGDILGILDEAQASSIAEKMIRDINPNVKTVGVSVAKVE